MLDRIEVRAGPEVPFTREFETAYRDLKRSSLPAKDYVEMLPLKEFGLEAILLRHCRFRGASHKIIFLQAGRKTLGQIALGVSRVLDWNPDELLLARIDLAVDLSKTPLSWAKAHVRVSRKRSLNEFGAGRGPMSRSAGGTLYFGRGADFIRVYDKGAERMKEFRRINRKPGATRQSFEQFSALVSTDLPILRFERQLRIGRIPSQLETLGDLARNIAAFNPFSRVVVCPGGKTKPSIEDYRLTRFLEGVGFRQTIQEDGFARTVALINKRSSGNASRTVQRLLDFVPPDPTGLNPPNLFELFQRSISPQLVATVRPGEHEQHITVES